ncbi:hypothetical protein [Streptomyces sp. 351MFTsu5.1]|uniref:hypothetical protein n=1 Tax=Streptomyces sp. 351MFTsu5.1 TaxID=1172180 RepID=UPI0006874BE0|nr:hypothetical protein [Streptomyces sp. 351MFTsu5.1]
MGTSLTSDFWRLFAVLLVIFAAATVMTSALLDALIVRMLRHRRSTSHRSATADRFERHLAHH